jgi:ubiquinone/menaquinone biosynthesis C-methylase UbiE
MSHADPRVAFFDHLAPTWDQSGPSPAQTIARLNELRPTLGLSRGQHVLEIGCGTGQVTGWLLDVVQPGRVTAIDFSPAMLALARQRGVQAEFRCLDVCSANLGAASVDVAFCLHSFPHFRDQSAALANIARAIRPGGELILLHLDGRLHVNQFHRQMGGVIGEDALPDPFTLKEMLREVELHVTTLVDHADLFCVHARVHDNMPE